MASSISTFRSLPSSPILSDDEEDTRSHSQVSLTYQELPPGDSFFEHLPNIFFSFEMIDCFIPQDDSIRGKNWYRSDEEEWPQDEFNGIKEMIVEVLKTEFMGWTDHPTNFPDYAPMTFEQLGNLLKQATICGLYQLSLKVTNSTLFSHYMDINASRIGIDALLQSLSTLSTASDLPQEALSLTAAIMGKILIYEINMESMDIVYQMVYESNYFDLISSQDLNRALSLASEKEHEALVMILLESNRFADFDQQILLDTLQMARSSHYDAIILTLMYSEWAQELITRPTHASRSSSSASAIWTGR